MGPHPDHLHDVLLVQDLVDETMLNVDPSGVGTLEISQQLLEGWGRLQGIIAQNVEQVLGFGFEVG